MEPDWNLIFQYLLGPIVVGIVVLAGQYFVVPKIEREKERKIARVRLKQDAFVQALVLIDQHLNAQAEMHKFFPKHKPTGDPVEPATLNKALAALFLLADNSEIPKLFLVFFAPTLSGDILPVRGKLIDAMRTELYGTGLGMDPDLIPFYVNQR